MKPFARPTRAMVLAAGLGIRMKPLSTLIPKPALPVLNRPIIAHLLEHLSSHGVTRVVVNLHHRSEEMEQAVTRHLPAGLDVTFSREGTILGTAGGLKKAGRHFLEGAFYLVNSDSLTGADLTAAATDHAASGRAATLITMRHDPSSGYRAIGVAQGGVAQGGVAPGGLSTARVTAVGGRRWGGGEPELRTFTGVHVLEPRVLEEIPSGVPCDINTDVYPWLLDQDEDAVGAWRHDGWWFEAGSPARYLELNLEMLASTGRDAVVGPGFFIDEEASVTRSVIGAGARLARGSVVEDSVIWDNVTVGEGVALRRCIVTSGVQVPLTSLARTIVIQDPGGLPRMEPLS